MVKGGRCPGRCVPLLAWTVERCSLHTNSSAPPSPSPPCLPLQLLLHYNRFIELCKRQGAAGLGVAQQAVALPTIMYFLKQYSR